MKNNQWVIEPFANMVCSLSILDTGLKRAAKIKDEVKNAENLELLKLSICQQYSYLNTEMDKIVSHIFDDRDKLNKVNEMIKEYKDKLEYHPDEITLMSNVVNTFYKHGKYYLD